MEEQKEINEIDNLIQSLKYVKSNLLKKNKLSKKAYEMSYTSNTQRSVQKASVNLNWQCMELDKAKTNFARMFKGSLVDVCVEEKEYNPSGFHSYKG